VKVNAAFELPVKVILDYEKKNFNLKRMANVFSADIRGKITLQHSQFTYETKVLRENQTTTFTIFPGTTITFLGAFPSTYLAVFSWDMTLFSYTRFSC